MARTIIGIIGSSEQFTDKQIYEFALNLGKELSKAGYDIVCGGKGGIMEAVAQGVRTAGNSNAICIIPEDTKEAANPYCDIIIPSGMGLARNILIVNTADILIALGGGAGTLSEIAFAWQKGKKVLCVTAFEGWAKQLAGLAIDSRHNNLLKGVKSIQEIMQELNRK